MKTFGARYIVRGTAATTFEAGEKERIVISEFPELEKAVAAYNGPDYKEALKALGRWRRARYPHYRGTDEEGLA